MVHRFRPWPIVLFVLVGCDGCDGGRTDGEVEEDAAMPADASTPPADAASDAAFVDASAVDARAPDAALEASTVEVELTSTSTSAGVPLEVTCVALDAAGEPIDFRELSEPPRLIVPDGLMVTELSSGVFRVEGTVAGDYKVRCAVGELEARAPTTIAIVPGLPYTWQVELPSGDCLPQGRGLPFTHAVLDTWGNAIAPGEYTLSISSTPGGATLTNQEIVIQGEGDVAITLALDPSVEQAEDSIIEPETTQLHVDSTPPAIEIASPARSSMLEQAAANVAISGTVSDVSGLAALEIEGEALAVAPGATSHAFETSQQSVWGLNVIAGHAEDACGNRRELAQSYLRSDRYRAAATAEQDAASVPGGLVVRLNQPVIDDFDRADLDDVASLAEEVLQSEDFNAIVRPGTVLASDPLRSGCDLCQFWADTSYLVRRHASASRRIFWDGPSVIYLHADNNALALRARLEHFDFPLQAQGCLRECACGVEATQCVPSSGTISGWAGADVIQATGTLGVTTTADIINVSVNSLTLNTTGLYLDIDCGWADFLCDAISNLVVPLLEGLIEDALEGVIASEIPPLIGGFLTGFAPSGNVTLPPPLDVALTIASDIEAVALTGPAGSGHGELSLSVQSFPAERAATVPQSALGAIARDGASPGFSSVQYPLGIALEDDVLNQLLWSAWYGGGLELEPDELRMLVGAEAAQGLELQLSATLPPIIMPGDAARAIRVALGDARVEGTIDIGTADGGQSTGAVAFTAFASVLTGVELGFAPGSNALTVTAFDADPELHVEITAIDDRTREEAVQELLARALRELVPAIVRDVVAAFPLPAVDLRPTVDDTLELTGGMIMRPNESSQCTAGTEDPDASFVCLTGELQ